MGFLDDLLGDVATFRGELDAFKNEIAGELLGSKQDLQELRTTAAEIKDGITSKIVSAVSDTKPSK